MKILNKLKNDRQDLINNLCGNIASLEKIAFEQQAEIEQWKEEANKYQNLWCEAVKDLQTAKTEAIKEFAVLVNSRLFPATQHTYEREYVKNLVKEMVGDDND